MNPETHRRYLDYLELRNYFARPDMPKLDTEQFRALDEELIGLLELERIGEIDAAQSRRVVVLRRTLLRD
jgi:hypothetical protein